MSLWIAYVFTIISVLVIYGLWFLYCWCIGTDLTVNSCIRKDCTKSIIVSHALKNGQKWSQRYEMVRLILAKAQTCRWLFKIVSSPLAPESHFWDDASNFDMLVYFWCIIFCFSAAHNAPVVHFLSQTIRIIVHQKLTGSLLVTRKFPRNNTGSQRAYHIQYKKKNVETHPKRTLPKLRSW